MPRPQGRLSSETYGCVRSDSERQIAADSRRCKPSWRREMHRVLLLLRSCKASTRGWLLILRPRRVKRRLRRRLYSKYECGHTGVRVTRRDRQRWLGSTIRCGCKLKCRQCSLGCCTDCLHHTHHVSAVRRKPKQHTPFFSNFLPTSARGCHCWLTGLPLLAAVQHGLLVPMQGTSRVRVCGRSLPVTPAGGMSTSMSSHRTYIPPSPCQSFLATHDG